jgi:hypothetical protein
MNTDDFLISVRQVSAEELQIVLLNSRAENKAICVLRRQTIASERVERRQSRQAISWRKVYVFVARIISLTARLLVLAKDIGRLFQ